MNRLRVRPETRQRRPCRADQHRRDTGATPVFGRTLNITRRRAYLFVEVMTSIMILGLLTMLVGTAVLEARRTRRHYYWRQAAAWAVDAQMLRYRAGADIDSRPPAGLIPDEIELQTVVEPGDGDWEDFVLVTVTATVHRPPIRDIHEQLSGYIPTETRP